MRQVRSYLGKRLLKVPANAQRGKLRHLQVVGLGRVAQTDHGMPADLGGDIYAALDNRHNIELIKDTLKKFVLGL
jgi:hypothetical protein